ncbi:MAG: LuxR C-terminal-related transcriptional regulator [Oscillospiraceae bacterium]|nr:LuxR C-terminal-related transcriptional regulator [Oscillospiraceae bacterium]
MGTTNNQTFKLTSLSTHHIMRHRLDDIFEQAFDCKVIYVIAGVGFGKTQAVRHYVEKKQDVVVRWVQLTACDNISSRYWGNFTQIISSDNPELAVKLSELGFPESLAQFKQFIEFMANMEEHSKKILLVFDDFHLIHSKKILTFIERCAHVQIPNTYMTIISQKEPEINVVSLHSKGNISVITEDALCFTMEEAATFFQLQAIQLSTQDISRLMDITKGWTLAINMLSVMIKRMSNSVDHALSALQQNIFKMLEVEAWDNVPKPVQKTLVKMSLLSDIPAMHILKSSTSIDMEQLKRTPNIAYFLWWDSFSYDARIHPLYREFLNSKQHILSKTEKQKTYERAARWCAENGYFTDAMHYCAKSHQYEQMVQILLSYPFKLPRDTSEYFLNILESLDSQTENQSDENLIILKNYFIPLLLVGTGRYEEARDKVFNVIEEWEHIDSPLAEMLLCNSYNSLSYIDTFLCTMTHEYKTTDYLQKAAKYLKDTPILLSKESGAFINGELRSYACLVGEGADLVKFNRFLELAKQAESLAGEIPLQMYAGYAELAACEHAFFKNQPNTARIHAHNAILKAREKQQHSIEMLAENYLLHIAMQEGNASLVRELLKQLSAHLDCTSFWNRQLYYDLYTGIFYAKLGFINKIPLWSTTEEKKTAFVFRSLVKELHINVMYNISVQKYQQALTILCGSYPRNPEDRFLFGEIQLSLLTAVARIQTGDTKGAMIDFERAYELSFKGEFEMFFIELGKELHPLIIAALKQTDYGIPKEWLKKIDSKATVYTKKLIVVANALRRETNIEKRTHLANREREILIDLSHGLSREEIAQYRNLSINTIKKVLNSMYLKLDARNSADAVRIALEQKLIE